MTPSFSVSLRKYSESPVLPEYLKIRTYWDNNMLIVFSKLHSNNDIPPTYD